MFFAEPRHIEAVREVLEPSEAERIEWRESRFLRGGPIPSPSGCRRNGESYPKFGVPRSRDRAAIINTSVSLAGLIAVKLRESFHP